MSPSSPLHGVHPDHTKESMTPALREASADRRRWIAPALVPHSTLTELTQLPLTKPLSLLFLQSSIQCFDINNNPVPC